MLQTCPNRQETFQTQEENGGPMKAATTNPFGSLSQLSDGQYHRPAHAHYDGSNTTFLQTSDVNTHSAFFLYENCKKPSNNKNACVCSAE